MNERCEIIAADGNTMAATALMHANTEVVAAYQITPSTQVSEILEEWKREGIFEGEVALMNGENDAFTACVSASQCGRRTAGPSCSQGLLYAAELLNYMPGGRCPVVILAANRAISAPVNIHADHGDAMPFRDSGALMFFAKNAQEVYDLTMIAFKTGEDQSVQLPVWVCYDGFEVSHTTSINKKVRAGKHLEELRSWLGYYMRPKSLLDFENPIAEGGLVLPNYFPEVKYSVLQAMLSSTRIIQEAGDFYSEHFWPINPFLESFETKDAENVIVVMGSRFGTVKEAVKRARAEGKKVGAIRIVSFRPFPSALLYGELQGKKGVAVLDRSGVYGAPMAPVCESVAGSIANMPNHPAVRSYIDSLGGRVLTVEQVLEVIRAFDRPVVPGAIRPTWIGVRGGDEI